MFAEVNLAEYDSNQTRRSSTDSGSVYNGSVKIGSVHNGSVRNDSVRSPATGVYVLKISQPFRSRHMLREARLLAHPDLRHPYIMKSFGLVRAPASSRASASPSSRLSARMCGGETEAEAEVRMEGEEAGEMKETSDERGERDEREGEGKGDDCADAEAEANGRSVGFFDTSSLSSSVPRLIHVVEVLDRGRVHTYIPNL